MPLHGGRVHCLAVGKHKGGDPQRALVLMTLVLLPSVHQLGNKCQHTTPYHYTTATVLDSSYNTFANETKKIDLDLLYGNR